MRRTLAGLVANHITTRTKEMTVTLRKAGAAVPVSELERGALWNRLRGLTRNEARE